MAIGTTHRIHSSLTMYYMDTISRSTMIQPIDLMQEGMEANVKKEWNLRYLWVQGSKRSQMLSDSQGVFLCNFSDYLICHRSKLRSLKLEELRGKAQVEVSSFNLWPMTNNLIQLWRHAWLVNKGRARIWSVWVQDSSSFKLLSSKLIICAYSMNFLR